MCRLRACLAVIGLALAGPVAIAQTAADKDWPASEVVMGKFNAGRYAEVIAESPAVLAAEPWNHDLRLAYANSLLWTGQEWAAVGQFRLLLETGLATEARLGMGNGLAWTGRMAEAMPYYDALLSTRKSGEAKLGKGNALRWMGRDHLAMPLFEELRAAYPDKDTGEEGHYYARRALRPRTSAGILYAQDNTPMRRSEPMASHTWRSPGKSVIFGLDAAGGRDWDDDARIEQRDYALRVESLDTWLAPRLSVSRQSDPESKTFAELRLEVRQWPLYVHVGRINWGKLSFTTPALVSGLTAERYGLEGKYPVEAGELRGFANHFDISDGNRIDNGELRFTSRWRPWGREIKPYAGVHWRYSGRVEPAYWSPETYAVGFLGVEGEWERRHWTFFAQGQVAFKLAGEANTAWAASVVAKRWIGDDWSVGVAGYAQSGTRTDKYRAEGVTLTVEKLW